jgi:hypothetical protein
MQQLWAQVRELWLAGERHWLTQEEMLQVNLSAENFRVEDATLELLASRFPWYEAQDCPEAFDWVWLTATEVLQHLNAPSAERLTANKVGKALSSIPGMQCSKANGRQRYRIPAQALDPVLH